MKISTTRQQMFGDINRNLNRIIHQMNRQIREQYEAISGRKAGALPGNVSEKLA